MKRVVGRLRLDLAQYREIAAFAQFGSDLDKATLAQLRCGEWMVEILKQEQYQPYPLRKQVMMIYAGGAGRGISIRSRRIRSSGLRRRGSFPTTWPKGSIP